METLPTRIGDIKLTPRKPQTAASSERADWVGKITDAYNNSCSEAKYRMTYAGMGARLAHVKNNFELELLFKECQSAQSFGKLLNWKLNPKNARSWPSGE